MNEKEIKERAEKELAEQVMYDCYLMCGIW